MRPFKKSLLNNIFFLAINVFLDVFLLITKSTSSIQKNTKGFNKVFKIFSKQVKILIPL